jgi:HSP20 family protein
MAMIRWNPSSDLVNLHSEMDRLFNELTEGVRGSHGEGNGGRSDVGAFLPVDIERTDDSIVIRASVPGFTPDEVNVTVDSGVLTIDARHEEEKEEKDKKGAVLRRERYTGRLYRQIALGDGVKSDTAKATFDNGVLTVTVPLAARPEPKKIPVTASAKRN